MIFKTTVSFLGLICLISTGCHRQVRLTEHQKDVCVSDETDDEAEKRFWQEVIPPLPNGLACIEKPVKKRYGISSKFRDPDHSFRPRRHTGTDLPLAQGTRLYAVAPGKVVSAKAGRHGTNVITVDMGEGWSYNLVHLSEIRVNAGTMVEAGQLLGLSGGAKNVPGSGPCTTGPHLHLSLSYKGKYVDAESMLCK